MTINPTFGSSNVWDRAWEHGAPTNTHPVVTEDRPTVRYHVPSENDRPTFRIPAFANYAQLREVSL